MNKFDLELLSKIVTENESIPHVVRLGLIKEIELELLKKPGNNISRWKMSDINNNTYIFNGYIDGENVEFINFRNENDEIFRIYKINIVTLRNDE